MRAEAARSRAGGVDVYRNVRLGNDDGDVAVRYRWGYGDERGEYAGFTAVCEDAYRHGHDQDDGEITVIGFYLSPKLNRDAVAEFLERAMNDQPEQRRRPVILVGDFNVDSIVRHVRERYGLDCVSDHNAVNSKQPTGPA